MKLFLCAVVLLFLVGSAVAQQGAVVVNVSGVMSCVTAKGETGFDATFYSLGGTDGVEKPGAPERNKAPTLADLTITKNFDACSEQLIRLFLGSKVIPSMTLIQYSATSRDPFAAVTIKLTNALINKYEVTGAPSVHPTEALDFTYSKMCITSVTQNPDGSLKSPVTVCYDAAANMLS
jgi:type VI protein secretion system component Hcp